MSLLKPECFLPPEPLTPADEAIVREVAAYLRRRSKGMLPGDLIAVKVGMMNNGRLTFHGATITDNNPMRDEEA